MLSINNLIYEIDDKKILNDITLKLNTSDHIAIIGPNGAGKTTFLKCLLNLYDKYIGNIKFDNQNIINMKAHERARNLSYVPQVNIDIEGKYNVVELMKMSRYAYEKSFFYIEADQTKITEILQKFDLVNKENSSFQSLSGGERQRALLAMAIYQQSKMILMDEPTSSLDPAHVEDFIKGLNEIKKSDQGFILVTHDLNLAFSMCEKIILLNDGKVTFYGEISDIDKSLLNDAFRKSFDWIEVNNKDYVVPIKYNL